jgi:microcin C transport system substrate-binding protein
MRIRQIVHINVRIRKVLITSLSFASCALYTAHMCAESLEFRHGVSQIPNYDLKYSSDFKHFDYVNLDAPKGGTLVLPYTWRFSTVSPMYKPMGYDMSYDKLIVRAGDEVSGHYCSLAESVAVSSDGRKIVFRLRPEARWHDGEPITSEDIKFSLDTFREDLMGGGWKTMLGWISSVETPNPHTVVISTKTDAAKQVPLLSGVPMIPAHYWRERDLTVPTLDPGVQSGPYRMSAAAPGRFFTYTRVPDYWGRDLPVNRGRFNFDTIRYDYYLDSTVAREALRAGEFDVWTENDLRHWVSSYDVPVLEQGLLIKGRLVAGVLGGPRLRVALNTKRAPFDDPVLREALSYAFDFEWQNRALHSGEQQRANSYFSDSIFAARGLPDEAEVALLEPYRTHVPDRVFDSVFSFRRSDGTGVDREGLSIAQRLLTKAGYRIKDGVLVNELGEPLVIQFLIYQEAHNRILLPYVRSLSVLGAQASIRMIDGTGYGYLVREGEFDAILVDGWVEIPPSWQLRPNFHSGTGDRFNPSRIDNPAVDAMVNLALNATDLDQYVTSVRALDRVLLWNFYQFPLNARGNTRIVYWNKFGRPELPDEMLMAPFPDGWWYEEAKAARITSP